MKKIITALIIIITVVSAYTVYFTQQAKQVNNINFSEKTSNSKEINISITSLGTKNEALFDILKKSLDKYKGNLFVSRVSNLYEKAIPVKYVYLNDDSYFSNFKLESGNYLGLKDMESIKFLSTKMTSNKNQVGLMSTFGSSCDFEIRTLYELVKEEGLTEGLYTIQLKNILELESFVKEINKFPGINISITEGYSSSMVFSNISYTYILIGCLLIGILIFYSVLNSYKKIGILKMNGFKFGDILIKSVLPYIGIELLSIISVLCVVSLIFFKNYNYYYFEYIKSLLSFNLFFIFCTLLFIFIPHLYVNRIRVSNMLKNKRPTLAIIIFNSAIKIMLSLFVILALISFFSNIEILKTQYGDNLKSWEKIKNYAVLPDITDFDVMKSFMSKENRYKLKNLYLAYNKKGGILADFADFQPKTRGFNLKAIDKSYKRDRVMINPNYLKMFPVYDTKGNEVKIAEDNSNFVLLLPDKYKNQEKEIRTFYNIQKAYSAQKIEIIWIANKQKLFSAAMSINPAQGNFVNEPVVKVLTERNGIEIDYDRIINYQTSPFKIKISDLNNVEESVRPELKEIGINKYVPRVTMVYDSVAAEVKKAKDMMIYISLTLVALLGLATLMIFQNVVSYFEQYKLRLAIQKFHGYKAVDMYSSYLFLILISWIVTFCLALVLNISKPIELLECSAAFMLLEIGITLIIVNFVEKRKVLKVTKGG